MFAPVQGDFLERAPLELLKACEEKRFTGLIEVEGAGIRGSVLMRAGEVSTLQLQGASGDGLDAFLALQQGTYRLLQQMPTLDGSLTNEPVVRGSLEEHGPSDVMRFCESAGLTGQVKMTSEGRRLEVYYEAGAMTAITVDGKTDAALDEAFRWRVGEFRITALPAFGPARRPEESGLHFLNVVEIALNRVIDKAESVREGDTHQRPIPFVSKRRRKAESAAAPDPARTVQVFFLEDVVPDRPSAAPPPSTTRHARHGDVTAELVGPAAALGPRGALVRETQPTQPARLARGRVSSPGVRRRIDAEPAAPVWVWIVVGAGLGALVVAALARFVF